MARDLTNSEVSAVVYNTRNIKLTDFKPIRGLRNEVPQISEAGASSQNKEDQQFPGDKLFAKLEILLEIRLERCDQAQEVASILKKIRRSIPIEGIISEHFKRGLLIMLLSDSVCRFQFLVEEVLAMTLPLIRSEEHRHLMLDNLLSNGAFVFTLCALKLYLLNPNIRTLATEFLAASIHFVHTLQQENLKWVDKKYASLSYLVHEIVLHSGTSFLPVLLSMFVSSQTDIGIRRTLKCIKFLVTNGSAQILENLATHQRFSLIRNCIEVVRNSSVEARIDAAIILTGLTATNLVIAEKLLEFNGWDVVRTVLTTPSIDFSEVPETWLERSGQAIRAIQLKISPKSTTPLDLDLIPRNHSTTSSSEPNLLSRQEKSPKLIVSQLESLPSSYWIQAPPKKGANFTEGLPKCKDRLLGSPFGDSKKLFLIQQKKAHRAKLSQKKMWDRKPLTPQHANLEKIVCPPINQLPQESHKNVAIAERLFGTPDSAPECSPIDQLSYEERLQVMMMQVRDSSSDLFP